MGATESKPKIINEKLNLRYDYLNIKDLDSVISLLKLLLKISFSTVRFQQLERLNFYAADL